MASPEKASETAEPRRSAKFYRRPLGVPWLIALIVVPLLLAAIGYAVGDRNHAESNAPTGAPTGAPALPTGANRKPTIPPVSLTPVSITRNGRDITLSGFFPDERAKAALLDAVIAAVGSNANIIDTLGINPDVTALDFSDAGPVFNAAASITNFSLVVSGDTITLSGTAASAEQQDAVEQAAENAWPNLNIVDKMGINGPLTSTGSPGVPPVGGHSR
ncbi:BON domain-containing protein [Mycobacterium sp.]|uniref:channel-forming protein ArfA/OmpATb n=1 Tax=Mycobacterium sp. TaxID=1785 RepID=UPI00127C7CFB|nr:BON domain-containing protein [Mycobacterium sp.]KAA8963425.1 MAG: BON domain-containing protein [Mycobacterium sp.]